MKKQRALERKIELLSKTLASFEKKLEKTNRELENLTNTIAKGIVVQKIGGQPIETKRLHMLRARTEQFGELNELSEQPLRVGNLNRIRGRHREILAMLINNGFHTYQQIASKLNISQSRARAYIAELKNKYNVPLRQVRDPEGYKVGIDVRFVEQILASK